MRNLLYLLCFFFLISLQACVQDEEEIFDNPSAERLSETLKQYQTLLTGAENGWIMEYYPKGDRAYGGYTLLLSFTEDEVNIASEIDPTPCSSLYALKEDTGPMLSFDTYNKAFHLFSDPTIPGLPGLGYEGDYEFIFMKQSGLELILKGKKSGNKFVMKPIPDNRKWEDIFSGIQKIVKMTTPPVYCGYNMLVENTTVIVDQGGRSLTSGEKGRCLTLDYINGTDTVNREVPFVYTETGIKFYEPVSISGKKVQSFDWSEIDRRLICTDNDVNAHISIGDMPVNKKFIYSPDKWHFYMNTMGHPLQALWQTAQQETSSAQGLSIYQAFLQYDAEYNGQFLNVTLTDGSNLFECLMLIYFRPVKWTDNELTITFSNLTDENGNIFYATCGGDKILEALDGRYIVSCNNPKKPSEFTFIKKDDPDMWFELTITDVYYLNQKQ